MDHRSELADLPAGARVVIRLPRGPGLASALLECFERELVAVPMAPRAGDAQLEGIVDRVSASAVVDGRGSTSSLRRTGLPAEHPDAAGLALIMFTSGSTGTPKGVMLSRRAVVGNATKTAALHGIGPGRPHGTCLPLHHCNALVMSLLGTHLTGARLVLHPAADPTGYFAALEQAGARTASIVPALLPDLLEAAPPWPDGLDYLITAAAPLTDDLARRFHRTYGPRLRQGYGLTEAVNFSATMPAPDEAGFTEHYLDRFPPVGLALPDTRLRLEGGEVWISTPDLMDGYWQDPAATAEAITADGWLRTGDLGEFRGDLLVLKGRTKERIDRGGEKHYPLDVERCWREDGLTGQFAAVGVTEATLGQEIGLVATDQPVDRLQQLCERTELRPAVLRIGDFRATATGKPQRSLMGATLAARRESPSRYERLLRYAAATAHELLRGTPHPDVPLQKVRALAERVPEPDSLEPTGEPVYEAFDSLRLGCDADPERRAADRAVLRAKLTASWPLSSYAELAAAVAEAQGAHGGAVPFGIETTPDDGRLVLLPHAPAATAGGLPWALDLLWTYLNDGKTGHCADRWARLRRLRHDGFAIAGFSALRAGRHDLGGVIWAVRPTEEE
ncbi:class I adenylate-forming enzyme family protein [Saccharopolyspora pogona]|uniref:class I adenylate-forming enzyme family protein n=1 Tax=Saccharopolyspora pogona TaxID=333966 RepID=UPI0016853682|nr:fatty acid--CoA ligase family protein [Saccharopolyspora pogona]